MSLGPGLVNICLLAEGFPLDICPAEVAGFFNAQTKASVRQIASLNAVETDTSSGWLLLLQSHDDQIRCLMNYKTFSINYRNDKYKITLNYPQVTLTSYGLNWMTVMEDQQQQMDSVTSESMFGDGNRNRPEAPPGMWDGRGIPGESRHHSQQMSSPPPPGPQGYPQSTQTGQAPYGQPVPSMEQGSFPPRTQNMAYFQRDHPPFYNPYGSNPNVSNAGEESGRLLYPNLQNMEWSMLSHPTSGQGYPSSRSGGSMAPGTQQGQKYSAPDGTDNRPVASPSQREDGSEPLISRMEDLNLRHEPFPYYPSDDQRSVDTYDTSMATSESYYHSDFIVLPDTPDEDKSIQHHHFHLLVTELPPAITESELCEFFEDRRQSGGGPITKVELDASARSAVIFFSDEQVIQRVLQKSPLLLKDKKIEVARSSTAKTQPAEPEIKMVEIRGLESEDEVEVCTYYFENPAKGGGDIENQEWNEQEKILFITFKDPEVAKTVTTKGHKIAGKVLEVSLYIPPVEEPDDVPPQCTVEVRGIDPAQTELYEIYFSSPKKGGDTIVDLSLSDDNTVMFITFETPEVAQRVAERTHKVGKRQLEVVVAPVEEPTPPCSVLIQGCDLAKEETYRYYFENPRKGGGDIADFAVDRDNQTILITFVDPEVAQAVVASQHNVGGRNLEVSLYVPKKMSAKRQKSQEPTEEEEAEAPLRTVVVSVGQHPLQSDDTYILYFESPRIGGGDIERVDFDKEKRLVYVTFTDPAVAEKVTQRQHTILGRRAEVSLYIPPKPKPTYPNKLLFQNVADSTSRDCLSMYLERITGLEPLEILYGDEVGTVLVTFAQEPDFAKTLQMTRNRELEKRSLTVSKVPISNCLLVENLAAKTTEDTVHLYFENKRSQGGPVERVEMIPKDKCLVYFENHEVLDGVLSQQHNLDGHSLKVKRYIECLGQSGGSNDPTAFTLPQPLLLDSLDRFKVAFLRQSPNTKAAFFQQLSSSHADGKFEGDRLIIRCTLTPSVPSARIMARTWTTDVQQTVTSFLTILEVKSCKVMQQLWKEVEQAVQEAGISCPEGTILFPVPDDATFVVVGMKSMAEQLYDQVKSVITAKEKEIELRKQEVTETISTLNTSQLSLLIAVNFSVEAGKRHKGLKVDNQKKKKCIVFHGMLNDVKDAQVEMYQMLNTMKSSKITSMTDMQKKVLDAKETIPYIVQKFKSKQICAIWEFSQQGEISVFAFDDRSLVTATHIITESVVEHVCQLSPESTQLLRHQEWQSLVSRLTQPNPGVLLIVPSHDGLQVYVTATDNLMHPVVEEVEKFFEENTIYSQTVCFSPSRQKLVVMKWKNQLQTIATNLRAYKVGISLKDPGDKIHIKGTRKGMEEVIKHLECLNEKIVCHEQIFEDPSRVKLLSSDCDKDLKMIGRSCQCILTRQREDRQLQVMESGSLAQAGSLQMSSSDVQTSASARLPNGVTVSVVQGDITQMAVGAIVNAANNRMDHTGGLAQDIVKKGGDAIQKECHRILQQRNYPLKEGDIIASGPGRLPCKSIIHAVGPMYKGGSSGEEDCLFDTVMACLQTANDANLPSIAIPAISTGIFGYPAGESTRVIVEAVKIFFESHKRCVIKSVYMCHIGADIVGLFVKALQKVFPSVQGSAGYKSPPVRKAGASSHYTQRARPQPVTYGGHVNSSNKIITVSVIAGEIAKQSADVIVNSTSNGLDLLKGAVSSSILRAAGQNLQMECRSKYPQGIDTGGMARTTGHGLNCREIFHIVLGNYSHHSSQQMLNDLVTKCLSEASGQGYTSLAFPVLGTGNLGYPAPVVAQTMLGAISQFEQMMPSTSLRDVRIIVYPADTKNLQEFQSAQRGAGQRFYGSPSYGARGASARQNRRFSEETVTPTAPSGRVDSGTGQASSAEFDIGGLRFVIKKGDITEEDTDAIVNSTNSHLDLSRGGVASALKKKCGQQLEMECRGKVEQMQREGIIMTKAYGLNSSVILHVNADRFSRNWEDGIELCFKMAEQNGVRSIAMPALGTGLGLSPSMSAMALFKSLVRMYKHGKHSGSLAEVRVVLFDKKIIPKFMEAVQETGEKHNKSRKGFFSFLKSAFTGGPAVEVKQTSSTTLSDPVAEKICLFIYAESQSDVREALKMFDETAKEKFTRKEINDEVISSFDDNEVRRVMQIGRKHKAELSIQTMTGRIICDGLHKQVYDCIQEIMEMIRQVEHKRQEKVTASMLANMIRWCYLEVTTTGTEQREYQLKENHIIEVAYQEKKPVAKIEDSAGKVYVIDFNSMMEYPEDDATDTVSVMRKDKIKDLAVGQVPEEWEAQALNETVKLVDLKATDQEYLKVVNAFNVSVRNVTVTNVSRVQNPLLYHQYMAKKAHLEKQNPSIENEKTLWHGTSADAITNINHHGFNRSFCGKNATVHGQGVYFAVNANYSANATYSPPDLAGNRYVYLCKVLVGHPTVGQQNLRVLPARSGPILYDSATDNPNNPSMYVIFHDTQAYPEYMVTFQ